MQCYEVIFRYTCKLDVYMHYNATCDRISLMKLSYGDKIVYVQYVATYVLNYLSQQNMLGIQKPEPCTCTI